MDQQVFEGFWDEVLRHADELAGKRVRVTVLGPPRPRDLAEALADLLHAAEQLPPPEAEAAARSADAWREGVAEKFRAQGFDP